MRALLPVFLLLGWMTSVQAGEEVVDLGGMFGGGRAILDRPDSGPIRGAVLLLTGGDGYIGIGTDGSVQRQGNWIVRTRRSYTRSGIASLTLDGGADAAAGMQYLRKLTPKVVVVAMSRGSLKVPGLLAQSPNGIVLASSFLDSVRGSVGTADRLPATLVVHHRQDFCRLTPASAVEPFQAWGGARVKTLWVQGGSNEGDPCEARAWHGFVGNEAQVTGAISRFVLSVQ